MSGKCRGDCPLLAPILPSNIADSLSLRQDSGLCVAHYGGRHPTRPFTPAGFEGLGQEVKLINHQLSSDLCLSGMSR